MTKRRRVDQIPSETMKFTTQEVLDYQAGVKRFASLVVVAGSEVDLGGHILLDRPVTIGRDPDVELPLGDVSISRRHARIFRDETLCRYMLEDLGSTNGTRLDGARVQQAVPLGEGDKIMLGASVLKFSFTDEVEIDFHEKVQELVGTDELTGLEAKHRFDAAFKSAVAAAGDAGRSLGVLMMDMDGLKQVNDTHGHHMGAYAIRETGRLIDEVLGGTGRSCRHGGDEFMAYLPTADRSAALALAERIRERVAEHRFEHEGIVVAPTISIGVAMLPEDGRSTDELARRADEALYRAKALGRNRVI